jgi:hypothetical protein
VRYAGQTFCKDDRRWIIETRVEVVITRDDKREADVVNAVSDI